MNFEIPEHLGLNGKHKVSVSKMMSSPDADILRQQLERDPNNSKDLSTQEKQVLLLHSLISVFTKFFDVDIRASIKT